MKNLVKQFKNISFQNELWKKKSKIILGISGGPDSVCLFDVFMKIKDSYALEIIIAHVNYGLRGQDSDLDEKLVRSLARKYSLKIEVLRPVISNKGNLENQLRSLRYAFFEKLRQKNNFDLVAVAHTLDDQAETFLMHLLRGSGMNGLEAMKFKSNYIIRPLLFVERQEILAFIKKERLDYRTDKTNFKNTFFRNKIRQKLIPFIEKNYNPSFKKTVFSSSLSIAEDNDFLNKSIPKNLFYQSQFSAKKILALHPSLQKRALLSFIEEIKQTKENVLSTNISEVLKALRSSKNKNQVISFSELKILKKGDRVTISKL